MPAQTEALPCRRARPQSEELMRKKLLYAIEAGGGFELS